MITPLLSVVIPARDEAQGIAAALESLRGWRDCEVVVAIDAAATDRTDVIAASFPGVRIVRSPAPGRGATLAAGAGAAQGRYLLFLHADSRIAEGAVREAIMSLGGRTVAVSFRIRLDSRHPVFRLIEVGINLRSKLFGLPYGDQGLLISRDQFERVGGFRPYARCEDLDLVLRLQRVGRVAIAPGPCSTSTRRWDRDGIVAVTTGNLVALARFLTTGKVPSGDEPHGSQPAPRHRDGGR